MWTSGVLSPLLFCIRRIFGSFFGAIRPRYSVRAAGIPSLWSRRASVVGRGRIRAHISRAFRRATGNAPCVRGFSAGGGAPLATSAVATHMRIGFRLGDEWGFARLDIRPGEFFWSARLVTNCSQPRRTFAWRRAFRAGQPVRGTGIGGPSAPPTRRGGVRKRKSSHGGQGGQGNSPPAILPPP